MGDHNILWQRPSTQVVAWPAATDFATDKQLCLGGAIMLSTMWCGVVQSGTEWWLEAFEHRLSCCSTVVWPSSRTYKLLAVTCSMQVSQHFTPDLGSLQSRRRLPDSAGWPIAFFWFHIMFLVLAHHNTQFGWCLSSAVVEWLEELVPVACLLSIMAIIFEVCGGQFTELTLSRCQRGLRDLRPTTCLSVACSS